MNYLYSPESANKLPSSTLNSVHCKAHLGMPNMPTPPCSQSSCLRGTLSSMANRAILPLNASPPSLPSLPPQDHQPPDSTLGPTPTHDSPKVLSIGYEGIDDLGRIDGSLGFATVSLHMATAFHAGLREGVRLATALQAQSPCSARPHNTTPLANQAISSPKLANTILPPLLRHHHAFNAAGSMSSEQTSRLSPSKDAASRSFFSTTQPKPLETRAQPPGNLSSLEAQTLAGDVHKATKTLASAQEFESAPGPSAMLILPPIGTGRVARQAEEPSIPPIQPLLSSAPSPDQRASATPNTDRAPTSLIPATKGRSSINTHNEASSTMRSVETSPSPSAKQASTSTSLPTEAIAITQVTEEPPSPTCDSVSTSVVPPPLDAKSQPAEAQSSITSPPTPEPGLPATSRRSPEGESLSGRPADPYSRSTFEVLDVSSDSSDEEEPVTNQRMGSRPSKRRRKQKSGPRVKNTLINASIESLKVQSEILGGEMELKWIRRKKRWETGDGGIEMRGCKLIDLCVLTEVKVRRSGGSGFLPMSLCLQGDLWKGDDGLGDSSFQVEKEVVNDAVRNNEMAIHIRHSSGRR